jgi:hypothetical protein
LSAPGSAVRPTPTTGGNHRNQENCDIENSYARAIHAALVPLKSLELSYIAVGHGPES